jgi:hypothetical protein
VERKSLSSGGLTKKLISNETIETIFACYAFTAD